MTVNSTLAFIATCIGFGFIPGPALLQTVSLTLQHGRRAGVLSALGIHLGAFFQICAVAIGAVVVLDTSPWLYHALRIAGGGYLIWLGIQRIRTREANDGGDGAPSTVPKNVISSRRRIRNRRCSICRSCCSSSIRPLRSMSAGSSSCSARVQTCCSRSPI